MYSVSTNYHNYIRKMHAGEHLKKFEDYIKENRKKKRISSATSEERNIARKSKHKRKF